MRTTTILRFAAMTLGVVAILSVAAVRDPASAAKLSKADKAWIEKCISDRKMSGRSAASLRKYCVCMQEVVEDNRPFESITDLERTYPPAHRVCRGGKPE